MTPPTRLRTAAALIIGNELLAGKIQDANVAVLARDLFDLGISLRRVIFCPDEIEVIAEDLNALRHSHDYVFTSGGVGPTHDDVTVAAIAKAFGQRLVRSEPIEALLRDYFGERCSERHLRMAEVPERAKLVTAARNPWPAVRVENVFILPGLPEIFRQAADPARAPQRRHPVRIAGGRHPQRRGRPRRAPRKAQRTVSGRRDRFLSTLGR